MAFDSQCWGSWKEIFLLQSERVAISPVLLPSAPGAAFIPLQSSAEHPHRSLEARKLLGTQIVSANSGFCPSKIVRKTAEE